MSGVGAIEKNDAADLVTEGNVSIEKEQTDGSFAPATRAGLTTNAAGDRLNVAYGTPNGPGGNRVTLTGGTGSSGWLAATVGGCGTSMEGTSAFTRLDEQQNVRLAQLSHVGIVNGEFTVTPDYPLLTIDGNRVKSSPEDLVAPVTNSLETRKEAYSGAVGRGSSWSSPMRAEPRAVRSDSRGDRSPLTEITGSWSGASSRSASRRISREPRRRRRSESPRPISARPGRRSAGVASAMHRRRWRAMHYGRPVTSPIILLLALMLVGAFAQRVTGMGFGLIVSPFVVLLLGPYSGVMILNIAAVVSASMVLTRVWRDVDWRRLALLAPTTIVGIVVGGMLAHALEADWLEAMVGALLVVGLATSQLIGRTGFVARSRGWTLGSGFAAGAMNSAAGIGGPAMTVCAVLTRWPQRTFSATLQPFFMMTGLASFATKYVIDPGRMIQLGWAVWVAIVVTILAGVWVGGLVAHRVSASAGRRAVYALSYAGGAVTLLKGLTEILS